MKEEIALNVRQLSASYDRTPVLWDITFQVPRGEFVAIIGPNGAGKSTLIKTILELQEPVSGKVSFFGHSFSKFRDKIAYIPQRETLDWNFPITVEELVLMGRYGALGLFKRPKKVDFEEVDKYLDLVGLTPFKKRQISELSGGQQQRAFLARALIQDAEIYFLDEPFAGIDMGSEATLIEILKEEVKKKKTVFVVHHDLTSIESLFSYVIMLNLRLVAAGPFEKVFNDANLKSAYGKNFNLFERAAKLAKETGAHIL